IQERKWYKPSCMGVNKLKKMLNNIATNTGINLADLFLGHRSRESIRSYSKPTDNQQLNFVALLIPFAAIEKDLEKYYNYPGTSYFTYESEDEDNIETNDNATSPEILECEFEYSLEHDSESGIEISSGKDTLNSLEQAPKCTRISYKTSKFQQHNSKLFSSFKSPLLKTKKSSSRDQQQSLQLSSNRTQEDHLDITQENHIQENQSHIMQEHYIQKNRLHNMRDDSIIVQNCPEIKKLFETITSNIIL
ncbi:43902_t:CDS:2, partial [Gigaspora margarita]